MPTLQSQANRDGILAMTFAMACFIANDALVKYVSQSLPAAQLIFIRGLFATAFLLAVAHRMGLLRRTPGQASDPLRQLLLRPVWLRAVIDAVATIAYLTSLFNLPIGNATAISMATPLLITLFAVLVWRERVGPGRWLALACGFTGVLLIVQPDAGGFNAWALLCFLATVLHTVRDLITRTIPEQVPSILVTVSTTVAVTLLAGLMSVAHPWAPLDARQLLLLGAASIFLSGAYYLIIVGMRTGEMSLIAPFRYTGLLFALLLGWLVWREVPNTAAWTGIALLVGAGIYVLHSQRTRTLLDAAAD